MSSPTGAEHQPRIAIIGNSLLKLVPKFLNSDHATVQSLPGAKILDLIPAVDNLSKDTDVIFVQVGSIDAGESPVFSCVQHFDTLLSHIHSTRPHAFVVISSIPPRLPSAYAHRDQRAFLFETNRKIHLLNLHFWYLSNVNEAVGFIRHIRLEQLPWDLLAMDGHHLNAHGARVIAAHYRNLINREFSHARPRNFHLRPEDFPPLDKSITRPSPVHITVPTQPSPASSTLSTSSSAPVIYSSPSPVAPKTPAPSTSSASTSARLIHSPSSPAASSLSTTSGTSQSVRRTVRKIQQAPSRRYYTRSSH